MSGLNEAVRVVFEGFGVILQGREGFGKVMDIVQSARRGTLTARRADEILGAGEFKRISGQALAAYAKEDLGVELDPVEPFGDASLSGAITQKSGITVRSVRDKVTMKEDALYWGAAKLESQTGVHLSNVLDKTAVLKDIGMFATKALANRAGVPITDLTDTERTKAELNEWGKMRAMQYYASDDALLAGLFEAAGVRIQEIIDKANAKMGINPNTGKSIVGEVLGEVDIRLAIMDALMTRQMRKVAKVYAAESKQAKRQRQMRDALDRFRDMNGHRMHYERVT